MLLRFGLANHYSVLDYVELSMVAANAIKDQGPDLLKDQGVSEAILPVALVYGANASGKSTVHSAMAMMREHVLNSFMGLKPGQEIPRDPFLLHPRGRAEPTRFDCDITVDGVRFHYGFEFNEEEFTQEWLYSYPEGSRRTLFVRDKSEINFGKTLKGRNSVLREFTRPNSLYLSVAAQNSHPQLSRLYEYFRDSITPIGDSINVLDIEQSAIGDIDSQVVEFLRLADTGIVDVTFESKELEGEALQMHEKITEALRPIVESAGGKLDLPNEQRAVKFLHRAAEGDPVALSFRSESRGTVRLVALARNAIQALRRGSVLLVDELDVSLHTLLAIEIVSLFSRRSSNPKGAQLIATTHDTNVLCHKTLRRDQIWFCEKDQRGSTSLYPLTDIRTRNTDNLEKGYLQGRYGAVPFLGRLDELFAGER